MESELNRCRDKLDFCKAGIVILCVVIMLLSAMLYFCKTASASDWSVGYSSARVHTKTQWVPFGGTVDFREASNHISAVSLSRKNAVNGWLDYRLSTTLFSTFSQSMIGHDASGAVDNRWVTTQAAVIGLTVEPHVGPFYVRYGTGLGLFDQRLRYLRDGAYQAKNEFQTGMVGITGLGVRRGGWSVSYDKYTDLVFRNSDLGGFNQRRERRHAELYTVSYGRPF